MNIKNYFHVLVLICFLSSFSGAFSHGPESTVVKHQAELVKEKLQAMHKSGNHGATELHAAVMVHAFDWIKCWVQLNINKPGFCSLIRQRDSYSLTPYHLANYVLAPDIAEYLARY